MVSGIPLILALGTRKWGSLCLCGFGLYDVQARRVRAVDLVVHIGSSWLIEQQRDDLREHLGLNKHVYR